MIIIGKKITPMFIFRFLVALVALGLFILFFFFTDPNDMKKIMRNNFAMQILLLISLAVNGIAGLKDEKLSVKAVSIIEIVVAILVAVFGLPMSYRALFHG